MDDRGRADRAARDVSADVELLGVYLNDHLAGSVAGLHRFEHAARALRSSHVGELLAGIAEEVRAEQDELRDLIVVLGYDRSVVKQVASWLAERVARLKNRGSLLRRSSASTLLEIELLRSAVAGKRGLWQTLVDHADDLGLERSRMQGLLDLTDRQLETLEEVHAFVRGRALRGTGRVVRPRAPQQPRAVPGGQDS